MILITGNKDSELAKNSNYTLWNGNPKEICPLGLVPTTSTTTMAVIGDILSVLLMKIKDFTPADYALRHHSGYLGEKSRNMK
jgi:arabinose-5-phosphate isomerase